MKHFLLREPPNGEGIVHLYREDYHYLVRVRRLRAGSLFPALLPSGEETQVKVLSTVNGILLGECEGCGGRGESPWTPILLFQGLPKGNRADLIVRQAGEAGVREVVFFESEYSVTRAKDIPGERLERWGRIVREARQQSGSTVPTAVRGPWTLAGLLAYWEELREKGPVGIVLHQDPLETGTFHACLEGNPALVVLAVGPEGGFSPGEIDLFRAGGFKPLLMGRTVLRTETAALYGAGVIRIILLENQSWMLRNHS